LVLFVPERNPPATSSSCEFTFDVDVRMNNVINADNLFIIPNFFISTCLFPLFEILLIALNFKFFRGFQSRFFCQFSMLI
jgi:hypothetical protein